MNERQFQTVSDSVFLSIEEWLEKAVDLDIESATNLLTISFPSGTQLILSKQSALKEIWLASPLGAYHFQHTAKGWMTRQDQALFMVIANTVEQLADITLETTEIPRKEFFDDGCDVTGCTHD